MVELPSSLDAIKKKWSLFQKHHWVSAEFANSIIFRSWQRCAKQTSPYHWSKPHIVSGHTLSSLMKRNQNIIDCATAAIEDLYDGLAEKQLILLITDDNGCVVYKLGDAGLRAEFDKLDIKLGSFFSEGRIGTNAINLCIHHHQAVSVVAAEHFNRHLHDFTSHAAPIFDAFGKLRGTVGLIKKVNDNQDDNLALITTSAREISLKILLQYEQENMNRLLNLYHSTLESIDDGVLAWNAEQRISMINPQAEQLLALKKSEVMDKSLFSIIRFAPNILASIENKIPLHSKQTTIEINKEFIDTIISLSAMPDGTSLLFIHPIDKIRQLAQQQIGICARYTFDSLPAVSTKMQRIITLAKRVASSKAPLLLTGEEGVGKTDLAMAIHNESEFCQGPFISLSCRNLHSEAMLKEVLGVDEGQGMPSKFELAHQGSLFLEKIEYLSPRLQAMLLKILKTGMTSRYDSPRLIPVKFRLMTSSSANLADYVSRQVFSRQLYYEISANEIAISPLRERQEDIVLSIHRIIQDYEKRHNVSISLAKEALAALTHFHWQGNNTELRSKMERILFNRNQDHIALSDLPEEIKLSAKSALFAQDNQLISLAELERNAILQAWQLYQGRTQEMAAALKISRTTLWRKLTKFGIARPAQ